MSETEFSIFELPNGLKVVHQEVSGDVAHCGLIIQAGSRDEEEGQEGLAHFIEHSIFKGTKKRRAYHILNRLDSVGGEIDAYTSKENTCYYASFLKNHYERAVELLSDIVFHSTFPQKELEKEKEVILDEINLYLDNPFEQIHDDFEEILFQQHPLAHPVLGNADSLRSFDKNAILDFTSKFYSPENMVFSSVGNISGKKLKRLLEKHFNAKHFRKAAGNRQEFIELKPQKIAEKRNTNQSHCVFGGISYGMAHPKKNAMGLLNNILGGPAMNSILNMKIREKHGYTYNIESNYNIFSDTGIFSIYLGTDPKYAEKCISLVEKELKYLMKNQLSTNKLHQAKEQLKGQIALGRESNSALMLYYGKSMLYHNKIKSKSEIYQDIEKITAREIQEVALENLNPQKFSYLSYIGKS